MISGRLVGLRQVEPDDLEMFVALTNNSTVRASVGGWDWPVALAGQHDWYSRSLGDPGTRRLTVVDLRNGGPIGLTGLWNVDWHNASALTAIKLMPGSSPKGAGSDCIMLLVAWAFYEVGLRRLYSTILDYNGPSLGAYVGRSGWRIEGREREAIFRKGDWHDVFRTAILRSEFDMLDSAREYVEYVCPVDVTQKVAVQPDGSLGFRLGPVGRQE